MSKETAVLAPENEETELARRARVASKALEELGQARSAGSSMRAFNEIMMQHARLMSMLWGGAVAVGLLAYGIGKWKKSQ